MRRWQGDGAAVFTHYPTFVRIQVGHPLNPNLYHTRQTNPLRYAPSGKVSATG